MKQRLGALLGKITVPVYCVLARIKGCEVAKSVQFIGKPIIHVSTSSKIEIGADTIFISKSSRTALGVSRPVILRTLARHAEIVIGTDCGLSGTTICSVNTIKIGNRVLIGADVLIADTDFHEVNSISRRYLPIPSSNKSHAIVIEDDVFIGARSIILKGVTIGQGSVIGAGSVVTKSVPPAVIAAGNPARILKTIPLEGERQ